MDIERQRRHFNEISERYRESRTHENHQHLKHLIWSEFLGRHERLRRPDLRVLEAMCGYAEGYDILTRHLGERFEYEGFDYSDSVVEYMKTNKPHLHVFHQDIAQYEPERRYDLILVLGGLHHVPGYCEQALARLHDALEPGGFLINLEPTHGLALTQWVRERIYERNTLFDEQTERAFGVDEYFELFERHGFTLEDAMFPGLLSYVLYYNPDAFPALNMGGVDHVDALFKLERPFLRTPIARALSFATLALWRKPL